MDSSKENDPPTSTDSIDRPVFDDRGMSYNRIKISDDLKSQICSQISDSTESLPLSGWNASRYGDEQRSDTKNQHSSGLPDTSDIATPVPEKDNPMDNLPLDKHKTATPLSTVSTAQSTGSGSKDGKDRPGTLRRLTTKIRRTMSSNPHASK